MNCHGMQEDSEKTGKVTSAGMYFLHFQVYRMDSTVNAVCEYHPVGQIHHAVLSSELIKNLKYCS